MNVAKFSLHVDVVSQFSCGSVQGVGVVRSCMMDSTLGKFSIRNLICPQSYPQTVVPFICKTLSIAQVSDYFTVGVRDIFAELLIIFVGLHASLTTIKSHGLSATSARWRREDLQVLWSIAKLREVR